MHDYLKHWGAERSPFRDLDWEEKPLLTTPAERLVSRLLLLCESDTSLIAITAPPGHGKTTFAKHVYQSLPTDRHEATLVALIKSEHQAGWLMPKLAQLFQTRRQPNDRSTEDDLGIVSRGLEEIIRERRRLVLILDEAHKLKTPEAFEEVHSLISLQGTIGSCVTTLLIGTDELNAALQLTPALRPRLALKAHLAPLSEAECADYMRYRLKLAGLSPSVFDAGAVRQLHQISGGIYSLLNVTAENALMEAYLQRKRTVDEASVNDAANFTAEQVEEPRRPAPPVVPTRAQEEPIPIQTAKKTRPPEPEQPAESKQSGIRLSSLFYKNKS